MPTATLKQSIKENNKPIAFIDLSAQQALIGARIEERIKTVLAHGQYIMGPEVAELEKQLSAFCGAKHVISCSNGTDALTLVLRAKAIGPGDAVFVPSFTFAATAEVVALAGAVPVFVDVDSATFNMDANSLERAIAVAKKEGLSPKAVISVDLFGQPADYDALEPIVSANKLWLLSDSAQGFGATYKTRKTGTIGLATGTSFFPAKPLGCYGDGGAVFTDDAQLAEVIQSLRVHGKGTDKYDNARIGLNARLDTLQAAILLEKLAIFAEEIQMRNAVATRYTEGLRDICKTPFVMAGCTSVWAQYTIQVEPEKRDGVMKKLKEAGVPSVVYYPTPLHRQTAYRDFPRDGELNVSGRLAQSVLSLPMHPYLSADDTDHVVATVRAALAHA